MVYTRTVDTEYWGGYIVKVIYYEDWDEEVPCRHEIPCSHPQYCNDSKGESYQCGYQHMNDGYYHAYDVDYHSECWTEMDAKGSEYSISKEKFNLLSKRFNTKPYFVDLHRDYHSNDGDSYDVDWNKIPETSENITISHSYTNKVRVSHSIFKFDEIDDKTKKLWKLYDYPEINNLYQKMVLGKKVDAVTERKLQYINGYFGSSNQFRMYILFFTDQSIEAAFKQRSYWEGGNKNEFIICIGSDKAGKYQWVKAFSWMDKPDLEVRVQDWFNDQKKIDLHKFADWIPEQLKAHWKRKHFKDFDYLEIELTGTQLTWIMILIAIYNIGVSGWIVKNEFY